MDFENYLKNTCEYIFKQLGSGYTEYIYHESLIRELNKKFKGVEREKSIPVVYIDTENIKHTIGQLKIDIFIHDIENEKNYLLELKTIKNINKIVICQINRYTDMLMKNYNIKVNEAYSINFTCPDINMIPENISINKII